MGFSTVGDGDDNMPAEHKLSLPPENNFRPETFLAQNWLVINTDAKISPTFKCRRDLILLGPPLVRYGW